MKCPHCDVMIHQSWSAPTGFDDADGNHQLTNMRCPNCNRLILKKTLRPSGGEVTEAVIYPRTATRPALPQDVLDPYRTDYHEASLVLSDSPKASAALSRRCLQRLLREKAGVKHGSLSTEIDEAMPQLPSHLSDAIDAVRNVGNFAAHPLKDTNTGEIIDVEPGEAEWLLDTLEGLFDFYFVQPALLASKKAALNQKLQDAGKPPMKSAPTP